MRNKRLKLLMLSFCCSGSIFAQTLSQAQNWFTKGEFEKAKPVFRKLTKRSPSNINYKYWYGACCYETGELDESLPYLEKSAERKVINAYLYLSKAYYDLYRFDDAIENIEEHIYWLEKKKRDTSNAEKLLEKYRVGARMIRGVEKVVIIDSIVTDKEHFLDSYSLSKQAGELNMTGNGDCTSFTNEMNDKIIFSKINALNQLKLYSMVRLADKWTEPEPVESLNEYAVDLNYPFVDSDGVTVYYSAKGEECMGGYDIFITRYDTENNTYLKPDNIGMPFNSPYNDYMYVIDDYRNLGWFVSDRYQPEGKVCIYVFIPNEVKDVYDYDNVDIENLKSVARLDNIQNTWIDKEGLNESRTRLAEAMKGEKEKHHTELNIIINDRIIYHSLNEFKSKNAAQRYLELRMKQKDYSQLKSSLENLREEYHKANQTKRLKMAPGIKDKEARILELRNELAAIEVEVRNLELSFLMHK